MNIFIEILRILVPSLAIMAVTFYLVHSFLRNNEKMRNTEYMIRSHEITVPLRLQAYERLTLFLERISLDSLLMRCNQPGMNSRQLHSELLATIRNEYEHNLSQQVYMSVQTWEMIKNARAQMIKVVNTSAEKTDPSLPAIELSKKILENMGEYPKAPTQVALDYIKSEIQQLF
jgi:hypothetical protein